MSQAALLTEARNDAVVQLPGRQFPGVVFQGDSLHVLISDLERVASIDDRDEQREELSEVLEGLGAVRGSYEQVLDRPGLKLPYNRAR